MPSSFRKNTQALVASATLFALLGCNEATRPNIILISIDCLNQRQFELAVERGYAPALAALEKDSVAFSRAYSHAPWTTPSHMSMLTGLYPSQHGRDVPYGLMIEWNDYFPRIPTFDTIGDRLGREGYDTAAFVGQGSISAVYGLEQGFDVFEEHRKTHGTWTDLPQVLDASEAWLSQRDDSPFFLFVHTYDLHGPRPKGLESDRDAIQYIDQFISRLTLQLETAGLYDSSLIILTGDHGSNMIETDDKCCLHGAGHYEENLKVPLLLKLPDSAGARDETSLARHIDLFPTVMDVAGLDNTGYEGPGVSLREAPETSNSELMSFSEADGRCAMRRALVTDRYKYIYTPQGETQSLLRANDRFFDDTCKPECRDLPIEELYDLHKDPFEKQNLLEGRLNDARSEALDQLRLEMAKNLNLPPHYTTNVVTGPKTGLDDEATQELLDSLKTLGYIK
jgi:arylsulfatase A-like enzyme